MINHKLNVQDLVYSKIKGLLSEGIKYELNYLQTTLGFLYTKSTIPPEIKRVSVSFIKPCQYDYQYENQNSKDEAKRFKRILDGTKPIKNLRRKDYYPILVNKRTNIIIDGNHRHYALSKIKSPYVVVLYVSVKEK